MATKVFISWSGERSQKIGKILSDWLPSVLQTVKPYFSPDDIEKGTKWSSEISKALSDSSVGIICLTRENLDKPWILFEAGALSNHFGDSNVCTALFDVEPSDIKPPLSTFQSTGFAEADFKRLLHTINNAASEDRLSDRVLDQVFAKWWPDLESGVRAVLGIPMTNAPSIRTERELLEETLDLVRSMARALPEPHAPRSPGLAREPVEIILDRLEAMFNLNNSLASPELNDELAYFLPVIRYLLRTSNVDPKEWSGRVADLEKMYKNFIPF